MNPQSLADKLKDLSLGLTTGRYGQIKVIEKLDSIAEELRREAIKSKPRTHVPLDVRPLLVRGMLATDARGPRIIINSEEEPPHEQVVSLWHEVLHLLGLTDEFLVEEYAMRLADAAPDMLRRLAHVINVPETASPSHEGTNNGISPRPAVDPAGDVAQQKQLLASRPSIEQTVESEQDAMRLFQTVTDSHGWREAVRSLYTLLSARSTVEPSGELKRLREFQRDVEEAEARCCPEDFGFAEWIGILTKRLKAAEATPSSTEKLVERIKAWAYSKPRKPAEAAFTAGDERQIAYMIEDASPSARATIIEECARQCEIMGEVDPEYRAREGYQFAAALRSLMATPDGQLGVTSIADELKLALLARKQFEGDPEGALTEMEHRVRNALARTPDGREAL